MNSMTMEFEVERQILSRTDNERVVEDSENYLYAHFTFSEDWDGTQKGIIVYNKSFGLKYKVYLNDEDTCKIPSSIIKYDGFEITAFGENENKYVVITSSNLFVSVLKSNYDDAEEPDVKYIISDTLNAQKDGDSYSIEIPNIYFKDVTFANDILTFFGRNNEMLKQIGLPYGLVNDITLNLDQSNYQLTLNAYDKNNNLIFSRSVDFNIEQKIFKDIYYDEDTKELVFVTMDDETIRVPIGDILTGIATQEWVNTNFYTKTQSDNLLAQKQNTLVNQQNIKSINGVSLLGSGDLDVKNLGYVSLNIEEIEEDDMFTLSDSQIAELQKDYSIIFVNNEYYKKEFDATNDDNRLIFLYEIYFTTLLNSGIREARVKYIEVDLTTKKAILHDEETFTFYEKSKADELLATKQNVIDSSHKLSSDLVDDSNATKKFVSASEKEQITTNANAISNIKDGTLIDSFSDVESALANKQDALSGSPSIDITSNVVSVKDDYIDSQFLSNTERQDLIDEIMEVFENE